MRDILDIFHSDIEISEKHIPVDEDMIGPKADLLLDLESRSKAKHPNDIVGKGSPRASDIIPKKKRDLNGEFDKFMAEEELDEAISPLRQAAMAAALTGAIAGGGKAVQMHNMSQNDRVEFTSSHAPQKIGDLVVGDGDWAFNGEFEQPDTNTPYVEKKKKPQEAKRQSDKKSTAAPDTAATESFINDLNYMTATIWGEARGEKSTEAMEAVGHVIKNRRKTGRWGETIQDVVLARKQFSCWNPDDDNREKILYMQKVEKYIQAKPEGFDEWYEGFKTSKYYQDYLVWKEIRKIAYRVLTGESKDITNGAIFYHTKTSNPYWNKGQKVTSEIGNHRFYKSAARA